MRLSRLRVRATSRITSRITVLTRISGASLPALRQNRPVTKSSTTRAPIPDLARAPPSERVCVPAVGGRLEAIVVAMLREALAFEATRQGGQTE